MKSTASRPILSTSVARRVDAHSQSKPSFKDAKKAKPPARRQLEQHESALVGMIRNQTPIAIVLLDGTVLSAVKPIGFDRYSVAIEHCGDREIIFKSAIARIVMPVEG
ncbi:RNA chaperone Hfq [Vreelandella sulfidaeris]|uniref:RNA chaperone Hfq n=1 Tax=Vreelandella sulfidaeris TaxID=115553 RepID=A0A455U6N4_9GAMM|nr:hypothetical protein HSBAA_29310 [Halomonas sulfidaeris]